MGSIVDNQHLNCLRMDTQHWAAECREAFAGVADSLVLNVRGA